MQARVLTGSQIGNKHKENQDRVVANSMSDLHLLAVIDGGSTAAFGRSIANWLANHLEAKDVPLLQVEELTSALPAYLKELNMEFRAEFADFDEMLRSFASLTVAGIRDHHATVCWAGDTLAFLSELQNGQYQTRQLTQPHSSGQHKLTRCFCGQTPFELETISMPMSSRSILTILSDGVVHDSIALSSMYDEFGFDAQQVVDDITSAAITTKFSDDASIAALQILD